MLPGRPLADEVRIRDQHSGRPLVGAHDADGLARLDQEGFVVSEPTQLADDGVERGPAARRAPGAAVHDESIRVLGDLRIEVVHEHPERRLLAPAATAQLGPSRRADRSSPRQCRACQPGTCRLSMSSSPNLPSPIAEAEIRMSACSSQTWYVRTLAVQLVM